MIEDTGRLDDLAQGTDAELLVANVDGVVTHGLRVKKGQLLIRAGSCLPVVNGKTCVGKFCEAHPSKYAGALAAPVNVIGELSSAVVCPGTPGYYHFLIFHLPRLFLMAADSNHQITLAMPFGVPKSMTSWIPRLAREFASGRRVEIIEIPVGDYDLSDVIVPAFGTKSLAVKASHLVKGAIMRERGIKEPIRELGPIKLFLRRVNTTGGRNLINQEDVEAWFVKRGYTPIDPGSLPFEEQVLLFSRATHIAGAEGGAMANIMFAGAAQDIVMITSPMTAGDRFFEGLAKIQNQPFRVAFGEVPRTADFVLPTDKLDLPAPG